MNSSFPRRRESSFISALDPRLRGDDARAFYIGLAAVLVLMLWSPRVHAVDGLENLFTTPAQRAALDRLRVYRTDEPRIDETPPPASQVDAAPVPATPRNFKLQGVIINGKSGARTVWIDGKQAGHEAAKVSGDNLDVNAPGDGKKVSIKPGQIYESAGGSVRESYQNANPANTAGNCRSVKTAGGETEIVCGK